MLEPKYISNKLSLTDITSSPPSGSGMITWKEEGMKRLNKDKDNGNPRYC